MSVFGEKQRYKDNRLIVLKHTTEKMILFSECQECAILQYMLFLHGSGDGSGRRGRMAERQWQSSCHGSEAVSQGKKEDSCKSDKGGNG